MQLLADVGGYLKAFGLTRSAAHCDRLDHAVVELELVAVLCVREAGARHGGRLDKAEVVHDA